MRKGHLQMAEKTTSKRVQEIVCSTTTEDKQADCKKALTTGLEAVIFKLAPGKFYADIIHEIREKVYPDRTSTKIKSFHRTHTKEFFVELCLGSN